jgi:hypothetical protein
MKGAENKRDWAFTSAIKEAPHVNISHNFYNGISKVLSENSLSLVPMVVQRRALAHILFHSKNKDEIQEDMTLVAMSGFLTYALVACRSMSIVHMHVATLSESPSTFLLFQYQPPLTVKWQNLVFSC